jgi:hypothetical protein
MRFTDFLAFDAAAQALYDDPNSQRRCRVYLTRLAETTRRHPGRFWTEAARSDVRRGVAFKSQALDDTEHAVFAQRLADRLPTKPDGGNYGDFLRQSVRSQGDVLGGMAWDAWEITKKVMELGGIDPAVLADPMKSPAQFHALVGKINWQNVTLPALKAKLGPAFRVPDEWKREFGVERLKRIKAAVEQGRPITDSQERRLLGIWKTLEVQLGGEILPTGPKDDVGMTRLPMSRADRTRFYRTLTGTHESVAPAQAPLQLSPQSAYDYLTQRYGVEVVDEEEAKDHFLTRILDRLRTKNVFIPASQQGSDADKKRWRDSAARSWGGFLPAARSYDPSHAPGVAQRLAGMTTRGFKTRTNPSGRRVPYAYNEPEEFQWPGDSEEMPGIRYSIDTPSQEIPNEEINAFYRAGTPEANAAVQRELVAPARDAVNWLRRKGWDMDPARMDDFVQQVVIGMLARTGSVQNWRANVGFRRATASMLARRFAAQGWPAARKEKTGRLGGGEDQPDTVDSATGTNRGGGEDEFSRMRGGVARARAAVQKAIAFMLDIDTSNMGDDDEGRFIDAVDMLNDPKRAAKAMEILDRLSARHASALPQVRQAVDRIQRHLDPLLGKIRSVS